jgi:hypothetical protein
MPILPEMMMYIESAGSPTLNNRWFFFTLIKRKFPAISFLSSSSNCYELEFKNLKFSSNGRISVVLSRYAGSFISCFMSSVSLKSAKDI